MGGSQSGSRKRNSTYTSVTPPEVKAPTGELGLGRNVALGGVAGPFRSSSKRRGTGVRIRAAAQLAVSSLKQDAQRLRDTRRRREQGLPELSVNTDTRGNGPSSAGGVLGDSDVENNSGDDEGSVRTVGTMEDFG